MVEGIVAAAACAPGLILVNYCAVIGEGIKTVTAAKAQINVATEIADTRDISLKGAEFTIMGGTVIQHE